MALQRPSWPPSTSCTARWAPRSSSRAAAGLHGAVTAWTAGPRGLRHISSQLTAQPSPLLPPCPPHVQIHMEAISSNDIVPMLEVQLELAGPDVVWVPEVGEAAGSSSGSGSSSSGGGGSVRGMVHTWVKSFLEAGTIMKRLDSGEGKSPAGRPLCRCLTLQGPQPVGCQAVSTTTARPFPCVPHRYPLH